MRKAKRNKAARKNDKSKKKRGLFGFADLSTLDEDEKDEEEDGDDEQPPSSRRLPENLPKDTWKKRPKAMIVIARGAEDDSTSLDEKYDFGEVTPPKEDADPHTRARTKFALFSTHESEVSKVSKLLTTETGTLLPSNRSWCGLSEANVRV